MPYDTPKDMRPITMRAAMRNLGMETVPTSIEVFERYIRTETQKWAQVIRAANILLDAQ